MPVSPADLLMVRNYCTRNSDEFTNALAQTLVSRLGVSSDQANLAADNCCRQIIANGIKGGVVGGLVGVLATSEAGGIGVVPGVLRAQQSEAKPKYNSVFATGHDERGTP